jgi:membrane associated rhomboid family serine protease
MDWSLVLVSQGIETTIDSDPDEGWGLIVASGDSQRAIQTLRQYHVENRRWPWQSFPETSFPFDWTSLAWVLLIIFCFWLEGTAAGFQDAGLMDAAAVSRGEWWRLCTAVFLHADVAHLAANAGVGLILLGLVMGRYGTGVGALAAFLSGVGGNILTWQVYGAHRSLGASGMVMGCIGLLAVQSISELIHRKVGAPASPGVPKSNEGSGPARTTASAENVPGRRPALQWKNPRAFKYVATALAGGAMLFAYLGLSPESDVLAHFGGFVSGLLLGAALAWIPRIAQRTALNICAGIFLCLIVIVAWWRALA